MKLIPHALLLVAIHAQADPLACFDQSGSLGLTDSQRITLCVGAQSEAPIECFRASKGRALSDEQRARLCAGAKAEQK